MNKGKDTAKKYKSIPRGLDVLVNKPKQREIFRTFRGKKIPVTIENFCECYPWEQIQYTLPKREFKQFEKWMAGQTCPIGGVYVWDFRRWMAMLPCID